MPDWRGALTYPFRGPERERPFLLVWVLLLFAVAAPTLRLVAAVAPLVAIAVAVAVVGYLLRVLDASERGEPAPPVLADWTNLVRRGVGGVVVTAAYLAIPLVLLGVTVYGAVYTDRVPDPNSFSSVTIYAGSTAVLTASLLGGYLLPIALSRYVRTGSLRAALSRGEFRALGVDAAYFAGWTAAFGGFLFAVAIAGGLATRHRAGPLVATALVAYAAVLVAFTWGRSLARAR